MCVGHTKVGMASTKILNAAVSWMRIQRQPISQEDIGRFVRGKWLDEIDTPDIDDSPFVGLRLDRWHQQYLHSFLAVSMHTVSVVVLVLAVLKHEPFVIDQAI